MTIDIDAIRQRAEFSADPFHAEDITDLIAELRKVNADLTEATRRGDGLDVERRSLIRVNNEYAAKVDELTAERDAARDMANTARQEARQALHALDKARAVIEAAKTWDGHRGPSGNWQAYKAACEALAAAVDALPTANTDDKPCCGYRCQDNTTGVTA